MKRRLGWWCLGLCLVLASAARAEPPRELKLDLRVDLPLTATGLVITALPLITGGPARCRLCGVNRLDESARRGLLWRDPAAAYHTSNVLAFSVPVLATGLLGAQALWGGGNARSFGTDALVVTEAVSLSLALNQVVKLVAARERPFVHFQNQRVLDEKPRSGENNVSFYSAHTSFAFSLVASTATLAQLRGYRSAPWIWAIGLPLAALTGYMRIAADRHYLSDVLVGAALSTAMGIALPRLLHGRKHEAAPALGVSPGAPAFSLTWVR